jgi:hypothetical protein
MDVSQMGLLDWHRPAQATAIKTLNPKPDAGQGCGHWRATKSLQAMNRNAYERVWRALRNMFRCRARARTELQTLNPKTLDAPQALIRNTTKEDEMGFRDLEDPAFWHQRTKRVFHAFNRTVWTGVFPLAKFATGHSLTLQKLHVVSAPPPPRAVCADTGLQIRQAKSYTFFLRGGRQIRSGVPTCVYLIVCQMEAKGAVCWYSC